MVGHVLSYFEFESSQLSSRQKFLVKGFLEAHGDRFTHAHAVQAVIELRYREYLS